jgi:GTP-binding protein EngB required for normal cell division
MMLQSEALSGWDSPLLCVDFAWCDRNVHERFFFNSNGVYICVQASRQGRLVVGLTGYPNVGKSSTINALFGAKKTAVAATPGKTKHFQTLNVTDELCLCDCPGLVMPQYARSKAEMVAAGAAQSN